MLTATDFFCGMGGSSTGLVEAGFTMTLAANHWDRAIETHAANHPDTEHLCADLQNVDVRYLPRTDVLWASPICTEVSPAGGRRKRGHQFDLFEDHGHVPTAAFERTRVTFWEVIRAAEVHRYKVVMIENVYEAAEWELFGTWVAGMQALGYTPHFTSANSAHIDGAGNDAAPQLRDRIYGVFTHRGVRASTLTPTPLAHCERCGHDVRAVQWWKNERRAWDLGKYGSQYIYVCPVGNHGRVEPYVRPAAAAIDWTDLGARIGDRPRPLAARTMAKIRDGLAMVESGAVSFTMAHGGRAPLTDVTRTPMRTQTTADAEGLALSDAFVAMLRRNGKTHKTATDPLPTFTAGGYHHALVVPFRRGSKPHSPTEPLSTLATREQHGVLRAPSPAVEDAWFRMLKPREAANAQRFPDDYIIHGNRGEQQMQAGNAVSVNAAHWIGSHALDLLDGRAA